MMNRGIDGLYRAMNANEKFSQVLADFILHGQKQALPISRVISDRCGPWCHHARHSGISNPNNALMPTNPIRAQSACGLNSIGVCCLGDAIPARIRSTWAAKTL